MQNRRVRVRFAPSPTGPLHIGGVRTALFNYLFAKKHGGDFLLRIEDTDQGRYVPGAEEYIVNSLNWLGLVPDESIVKEGKYGPYRQSERKEIYQKYAIDLIHKDKAYYAFDTPEELEIMREKLQNEKSAIQQYNAHTRGEMKNSLTLSNSEVLEKLNSGENYVIRFKMPANEDVVVQDIIRGQVTVNSSLLDDKVLFKSDGMPTYHLANIVDDYLMQISHVIRGEEWLPSLPLHVMLYRAFGWETVMPEFAHLPLILKPEGKGKLSKRDGDKMGFPVFPLEWQDPETGEISSGYRESGYFPDAVINILALLGWNPGIEQEFFNVEELAPLFSLERVGKSGSRFDPEKAKWFNQHYLRNRENRELAQEFSKLLKLKNVDTDINKLEKIVALVKDRSVFVKDFWEQSDFFFVAPMAFDEKTIKKRWKEDSSAQMLQMIEILEKCQDFSAHLLESEVKAFIEQNNMNIGAVMNAFRVAIVGESKGPHLFDILEIIGKEQSISRLNYAIEKLK